ncbi:proteasomal ubiquitin receptor ADRM1-A-like [Oscarella lobularis]|uniref:proteasomal ubiquitin receptor ADRM1-A-like n=1 Tax=Oscarella lobularis TaxID=121494 RepID=UPI003314015E
MALFASSRGSGAASRHYVEFRAGKMTLKNRTLTADTRKGQVFVWRAPNEGFIHFCWKDRTTGRQEDDLYIFPDDAEFKRIDQCKTGRVYVLKFKTSNRRLFFWLQEPKTDKDDLYSRKINDAINNPEVAMSGGGDSRMPFDQLPPGLASHLGENQLAGLMNGMDRQQLMQLFGFSGGHHPSDSAAHSDVTEPSRGLLESGQGDEEERDDPEDPEEDVEPMIASDSTPAKVEEAKPSEENEATATDAPLQLPDMKTLLENMQRAGRDEIQPEIAHILSSETTVPLLQDQVTYERVRSLQPEGLIESQEASAEDLSSPQFQQAVRVFSSAFETGQLAPLVAQFGLPESATQSASIGDMIGFLTHLQEGFEQHDNPKDEEID